MQGVMLIGVLVKGFEFSLDFTLGLSTIYFIFIICWKPYYPTINIHNNFLKLNHGTVVLLLVICELFSKINNMNIGVILFFMYFVMALLSAIIIGGFVRIYLEYKFRKMVE